VRITGPQGAVEAPLELDDGLMPGACSQPHRWGHGQAGTRLARLARLAWAAERPGANLNDLLDDRLRDPLSGHAVLSGVSVVLEAAG
jgi:hypothetical protein